MNRILSPAVACLVMALTSSGCVTPVSRMTASAASAPGMAAVGSNPDANASAPFEGDWRSCAGDDAPEHCSRYRLLQRGRRICGTWSYFASGDGYEGKVIAEANSPIEARRTRICGRPGSETRMECDTGWDTIDRPLRLCDGRLGDLDSSDDSCFADFERVESAGSSLAALAREPWMQACLSSRESAEGP